MVGIRSEVTCEQPGKFYETCMFCVMFALAKFGIGSAC